MPRQTPTVLVVVPTLGERLDTLESSLASVRAQDGVDPHLVLVLPRAAVEARAIGERFGATLVDDPKTGLSGAVNAGIAAHRGEDFYAWLGDDDLLRPEGLRTLAALLDDDQRAVAAYGGCAYIDGDDRVLGVSRAGAVARWLIGWGPNLVPQPASLCRLPAVLAAGEYDEDLRFAMDLDMWLRLRKSGRLVSTRTEVAAFRWHADSLTVSQRALSLAETESIKRRHLPAALRPVSPAWTVPVRWATHAAARAVNARARRVDAASHRS